MKKYAVTFKNKDGLRVLTRQNTANNFHSTKKAGETWLNSMLANSSKDTVKQVFGDKPDFKVIQVECYENGDCTRTVFPD